MDDHGQQPDSRAFVALAGAMRQCVTRWFFKSIAVLRYSSFRVIA